MILWIALAVLAALTVVALIRPLLTRTVELEGGDDREVYTAQLGELEADRARGLIGDAEATAARTEIARRLLRSRDGAVAGRSRGRLIAVALAVALFVPLFSVGAYLWLGTPDYGDQPLQARLAPIDDETLQDLVTQAEERLAAAPDDGEGWLAIAPVYARLGRFADAANAYGRVNALMGERAEWLASQGENLAFADEGVVSDEASALFEKALAEDPQALRPAIFLAIAARQAGDFMLAGERWRHILARSDGTEPWLQIANAEFMRIAEATGAPPSGRGRGGAARRRACADGRTADRGAGACRRRRRRAPVRSPAARRRLRWSQWSRGWRHGLPATAARQRNGRGWCARSTFWGGRTRRRRPCATVSPRSTARHARRSPHRQR